MEKLAIFDKVVRTMKEDSSTKKDIAGADPAPFRKRISEEMSEKEFLYVVHSYLASFGILSHVGFFPKQQTSNGFRLRYYQGSLYVTEAVNGTGLEKGDCIQTIDGLTIEEVYQQEKEFFVSSTPERQYMEWGQLVREAKSVGLVRKQEVVETAITPKEWKNQSAFSAEFVRPDIYYVKMENFSDEAAIAQLYETIFPVFSQVKKVIIDVRTNHGGSDSLYFPLFPYALSAEKGFKDLEADEGYGMEILYTPTNVANRLALFEEQLQNPDLSMESRQMIKDFTKELQANQDKGYLMYGDEEDEEDFLSEYVGLAASPEQIVILTDVMCGSSGDNFVDIMKKMPKVTVMGRPTMGILDYSNCCFVDFGDYQFIYPTSRSLAIDAGEGMTDRGVLPDIEIPWTPAHLQEDVDLAMALNFLSGK